MLTRPATRIRLSRCDCRRLLTTSSGFVPARITPSPAPPHLLTLADLSIPQLQSIISTSLAFKQHFKSIAVPLTAEGSTLTDAMKRGMDGLIEDSEVKEKTLEGKTVALMFSKRSTRTRVATETAVKLLGAHPMFLGSNDIQLGVNESLYDTARVVSSMVDGIMARVGHHSEVETLAANSTVPVINALSHLYHPTQILADLLTLLETLHPSSPALTNLKGLTIAWVGDANNILNEMLVTYPRLGVNIRVATPEGYEIDKGVLETARKGIEEAGADGKIIQTNDPLEAVKGADVVTTDTWISMGQEEESAKRLKDFTGYQITESMLSRGGANPNALFMHCLPRHSDEVDDQVFYGERSVVFPEAENRKWTILAVMHHFVGKWKV